MENKPIVQGSAFLEGSFLWRPYTPAAGVKLVGLNITLSNACNNAMCKNKKFAEKEVVALGEEASLLPPAIRLVLAIHVTY